MDVTNVVKISKNLKIYEEVVRKRITVIYNVKYFDYNFVYYKFLTLFCIICGAFFPLMSKTPFCVPS